MDRCSVSQTDSKLRSNGCASQYTPDQTGMEDFKQLNRFGQNRHTHRITQTLVRAHTHRDQERNIEVGAMLLFCFDLACGLWLCCMARLVFSSFSDMFLTVSFVRVSMYTCIHLFVSNSLLICLSSTVFFSSVHSLHMSGLLGLLHF